MGCNQRQRSAGLERIDRLGEAEVVQRQFLSAVVELHVGERHVADHRVDAALRQPRVAEAFDADVLMGVDCLGDTTGNLVQFNADETMSGPSVAHEVAAPQPGSRIVALAGTPRRSKPSCIATMTVGDV